MKQRRSDYEIVEKRVLFPHFWVFHSWFDHEFAESSVSERNQKKHSNEINYAPSSSTSERKIHSKNQLATGQMDFYIRSAYAVLLKIGERVHDWFIV